LDLQSQASFSPSATIFRSNCLPNLAFCPVLCPKSENP
jgi:hypothetical protein